MEVTSELNTDAKEFFPTFLRKQPAATLISPESPVVFLIYGSRGTGKSTLAARLAVAYNLLCLSFDEFCSSSRKQPFVELRSTLKEHFGDGKERRYSGVVLDSFIANSEFEAFYVQSALSAVGLPVPFVFLLTIDPGLAVKRAGEQGDLFANRRRNAVEQRVQAISANTIYAPIGCLKTIRVSDGMTMDDVFDEMNALIATQLPPNRAAIKLPQAAKKEESGMELIEKYETYVELANDVHTAIGNIKGRRDSAPLSAVGAQLDRTYFSFSHKKLRSQLATMHVTLKVDGHRLLLVKHTKYGYIGFPSAFTHCYDFNDLFQGVEMSPKAYTGCMRWMSENFEDLPVDFLLDTEIVVHDGKPTLYVIDFIYFWGLDAKRIPFEKRLKLLLEYFASVTQPSRAICMKDYVPVNKVRTLVEAMKKWNDSPIDGLIFQHNGTYRFGFDKFLVKWKPADLCTVDFRLGNGRLEGGMHVFDLFVTDDHGEGGGFREVPFPGAFASLEATVVAANALQDGMIVEMTFVGRRLARKMANCNGATDITQWNFRNMRNDKPSPNKYSVVSRIIELDHLNLEELVDLCEKIPFYGSTQGVTDAVESK
uniref:Uncharacterized protein TCIL3000_11_14860 n=1 Tax=Trypanosoma congolense (strain IL3000) TaxID=1068625 RepID=G0V2U7_TRYCI|nr:unnamed protein product [Trypanosoma congolense IL3000]